MRTWDGILLVAYIVQECAELDELRIILDAGMFLLFCAEDEGGVVEYALGHVNQGVFQYIIEIDVL